MESKYAQSISKTLNIYYIQAQAYTGQHSACSQSGQDMWQSSV